MAEARRHDLSKLFQFLVIEKTRGRWRLIDPSYGIVYAIWNSEIIDGPDLRDFLKQFQGAENRWLRRGDRPVIKASETIRPPGAKRVEGLSDLTLRKFHKILVRTLRQRLKCLSTGKEYIRLYESSGRPKKKNEEPEPALETALSRLMWLVG